ncbi:MAG: FixH family protein [Rhodomicrobiaceae bacterium]
MTSMAEKRFTGRHVLLILAGFFGVMFAVNGVFVYFALSTFSGVDSPTAYQDGLKYNERIEEGRRQQALGWSHKVLLEKNGKIELAMTDAKGEPVAGLAVSGQIGRPVDGHMMFPLVLKETGTGIYSATAGALDAGNWIVSLQATKSRRGEGRAVYRIKERLWLKPNS